MWKASAEAVSQTRAYTPLSSHRSARSVRFPAFVLLITNPLFSSRRERSTISTTSLFLFSVPLILVIVALLTFILTNKMSPLFLHILFFCVCASLSYAPSCLFRRLHSDEKMAYLQFYRHATFSVSLCFCMILYLQRWMHCKKINHAF